MQAPSFFGSVTPRAFAALRHLDIQRKLGSFQALFQRVLHDAHALLDHAGDGAGEIVGQQIGDPHGATVRIAVRKTCSDAL